jgi:hypothetical protein
MTPKYQELLPRRLGSGRSSNGPCRALGYPSQLLCIFPRPIFFGSKRGVRKSVNEQTLERLEKVKHAFQGTPWSLALAHIAQPQDSVRHHPSRSV